MLRNEVEARAKNCFLIKKKKTCSRSKKTSLSNLIETLDEVTSESEESILLDQNMVSTLDY